MSEQPNRSDAAIMSWQVRHWGLLKTLETGEKVFEVELLGIDDPPDRGEELIPFGTMAIIPFRAIANAMANEDDAVVAAHTDFCRCGHTRGSHKEGDPLADEPAGCCIVGCGCQGFQLLAAGVEGVEEMPPAPSSGSAGSAEEIDEGNAINFLERLVMESGMDELDPETWMALQRLLTNGWRITPPNNDTEEADD